MPLLLSSSKAIKKFLYRKRAVDISNGLGWSRTCTEGRRKFGAYSQTRCFSSIARTQIPVTDKPIDTDKDPNHHLTLCTHNAIQRRWFLGCGDGEEGSVLAKTYEEWRVIGYSAEQLFAVVAAVDLYEDFVPWCQRSKITRQNDDGSFDAELEIGFKFLVESYMSHVELNKPKSIKTTASESGLFEYLINIWEFKPGPTPGTCVLYFLVDFKFQSPIYRQVASVFFKEVVSKLVGSFNERCCKIYGPGVRVMES